MSIYTSTDTAAQATLYTVRGYIYSANDSDEIRAIDPLTESANGAGIAGPSVICPTPVESGGGIVSAGTHLFRYRWRNSRTGYVSNPSEAIAFVSTANKVLTFTFTSSHVSADSRVDEIIVEMSGAGSGDYYVGGLRANSAGTVVISMSDLTLYQQQSVQENWGGPGDIDSFGHNKPPLAAFGFEHNGIHFVGGGIARTMNASLVNGSPTITGTFSANWNDRRVQVDGETTLLKVTGASSTTLTLSANYTGTTGGKQITVYPNFPNRVYWSIPGYPEAFERLSRARDALRGRGDALTSGVSHGGRAFFFGLSSCEYWSFNTNPAEAQVVPIPGNRGNFNTRTLVGVDGVLFAWDRQGMYAVTGGTPERISDAIDSYLDEEVDYSKSAKFHAGFDPVDRQLLFFYVKKGDTLPKYAAAYSVDDKKWTVNSWRQAITASCQATTSAGDVRLMLGDENGKVWYYGIVGWRDGFSGNGEFTAQAGTTASSLILDRPMPTSYSIVGVMATVESTGESRPIATVSDATITVSPAFSAAPAVGAKIHLGSFPLVYETKWWVGQGQENRKRPRYLLLKMHPSSTDGSMAVSFYSDFHTNKMPYTRTSGYKWPDGMVALPGATSATISLAGGNGDGVIMIPIPAGWTRAVKARIEWSKPIGAPKILGLDFLADDGGMTVAQ